MHWGGTIGGAFQRSGVYEKNGIIFKVIKAIGGEYFIRILATDQIQKIKIVTAEKMLEEREIKKVK